MRPTFREHTHRAFPIVSKMKVVADVDLDRTNTFMNVMTDESLGTDLRKFPIEGLGDHRIESEVVQRLDLLFEGIEKS